jgi:regulator of protease activity HflC (stomatin/prohibitin superfamily)
MQTVERPLNAYRGSTMVIVEAFLAIASFLLLAVAADTESAGPGVLGFLGGLIFLFLLAGFLIVQPNHAKVATFFGRYVGTLRQDGFFWVNPFTVKHNISLRIHNFDSDVLKVNDAAGNPVEIAAVVAWQVVDSAMAVFDVEDYESFVAIQSETAVRHVASEFPYDDYEEGQHSLRGNAEEVMAILRTELQDRLRVAGVHVIDTRLRRLAYAPEIAGEMLRRQQATAVVAARQRIVEGAVGMVDMALRMLTEQSIVELDPEAKSALVANLLVVLVSDRGAQPVVSAGAPG